MITYCFATHLYRLMATCVGSPGWLWWDVSSEGWTGPFVWDGTLDVAGGWCQLLAWSSRVPLAWEPTCGLFVGWPSHCIVAGFQDSLKSECPKGKKWNLPSYGLHSELAQSHFLYVLFKAIPVPTLILEGGEIDPSSGQGVSGSLCVRACKTLQPCLENITCHKILKSKLDIKSL